MPFWAALFLAVAALAGLFGFGGFSTASVVIARVICAIFLGLGIGALALHGRKTQGREGSRAG